MDELVEYLAQKTGCMYISDLPRCHYSRIVRMVEKIPDSRFSVSEWNRTVSYIYHKKVCFDSVKEAVNFIYEHKVLDG